LNLHTQARTPLSQPVPYPHPILAREGWPFIAASLLLALLATWFFGWASVPLWLLAGFVVQFFRDPPRLAPEGENLVLSPADGRIVAVQICSDPYHDEDSGAALPGLTPRQALKISVFMNVFNVHSNRTPVDGNVVSTRYFPGKFFNAALDKASKQNERNAVVLRTGAGHIVTCVQVAGLVARRILCHVKPGDALYQGQRYGFIRFGSRVDVYLPPASRPRVVIGDKVSATSTVLAELHSQKTAEP